MKRRTFLKTAGASAIAGGFFLNASCSKARKPNVILINADDLDFDFIERAYMENVEFLGLPEEMRTHNMEWVTEGALKFIEQSQDQPFFLYMPLPIPHGQYFSDWEMGNKLATPAGMLDKAPDVQPPRQTIFKRLEQHGIDKRNAMATWMDDSVGAVLAKLDELGLAEHTMVIFTSDHQSRGKFTCYEGNRVPFLLRWPGHVEPGSRIDQIAASVDIAPTCIELAGGTPPENMSRDGRSFLPLLKEQADGWRDSLLLECAYIKAVVTPKWKYIANRPPQEVLDKMQAEAQTSAETGEPRRIGWSGIANWHRQGEGVIYSAVRDFPNYFDKDQLYDLENDPFEQRNLVTDVGYGETASELKEKLSAFVRDLPHTFGEFGKEAD
ncbi:MAG: sulfatase-like hydrolase/transferase [candidate division KSB1 bacterium]|nr:sulfatase-like hydrolase/transferase [candidate division KSB1 bacterium]